MADIHLKSPLWPMSTDESVIKDFGISLERLKIICFLKNWKRKKEVHRLKETVFWKNDWPNFCTKFLYSLLNSINWNAGLKFSLFLFWKNRFHQVDVSNIITLFFCISISIEPLDRIELASANVGDDSNKASLSPSLDLFFEC